MRSGLSGLRAASAAALLLLQCAAVRAAEPYTPASDAVVLARASGVAANDPDGLRALRTALRARPKDADLAATYARRALALGRDGADPRYFGYAEAALAPWWTQADPPPAIRLQRALLLQRRHDFTAARADLDALLSANPRDAEARLARAVIHLVQGRAAEAQADCAALAGSAGLFTATTCLAASGGVAGQGARRYPALVALLATPAALDASAEERRWAYTVAAELAARLGRDAEADAWFERAWQLADQAGIDDAYLQASWADVRLDLGDAAAVLARLGGRGSDAARLRYAMAARRLADAGDTALARRWPQEAALLTERFALARARGESGHGREEAMAALWLRDDARAALALARDNWQAQREPADARIYLDTARAANDPASIARLHDWLRETGLEDARLLRLAGQPGAAP